MSQSVYNPNLDPPPITGNEVINTDSPRRSVLVSQIVGLVPSGATGATGATGASGATGVFTMAAFAATDLSALPTSDPGGGRPWLKAGDIHVGA